MQGRKTEVEGAGSKKRGKADTARLFKDRDRVRQKSLGARWAAKAEAIPAGAKVPGPTPVTPTTTPGRSRSAVPQTYARCLAYGSPRSRWGRSTTTATSCSAPAPARSRSSTPRLMLPRCCGCSTMQQLSRIVTTHRHPDHVGALAEMVAATGAVDGSAARGRGRAPGADGGATRRRRRRSGRRGGAAGDPPVRAHARWRGPALRRGRSAGIDPHLFTGDSLFPGGPGNTQNDQARFGRLMDDLERKVFGPLPDATWVYPGHGADTTLGTERPFLPEWRQRGW